MSTTKSAFREIQHYEMVEYAKDMPFRIHNITKEEVEDELGQLVNVLEHWHSEAEIVYTFAGHARHYIDGRVHIASPGSLFIVNSESIHKVISDPDTQECNSVIAVVLHINYDFIKKIVPDIQQRYFVTDAGIHIPEIDRIMKELSACENDKQQWTPYEQLRMTGLVYELMYWLCEEALAVREEVLPINNAKNLERLRGIMQYVGEHYMEPITQQEVASRFYFTKEYFSRFFKKNTGMTFKDYLTRYRINASINELLYTDRTILDIAVDHGFSDARGFINAFKNVYGTTPLQYRKTSAGKEE